MQNKQKIGDHSNTKKLAMNEPSKSQVLQATERISPLVIIIASRFDDL